MFRSLRSRSILSHLLPLLVVVPLMGIALIYGMETRILLPDLLNELAGQALLVVQATAREPNLWTDSARAQEFVKRISPNVAGRLMLLDVGGRLLASSDATDQSRLGQVLEYPNLGYVLGGQGSVGTDYSTESHSEIADVLVPVADVNHHLVGVVRLSYPVPGAGSLLESRYLVLGILTVGVLLGVAVGGGLALNLERPLRQAADAIDQMAHGSALDTLPERGFSEINMLIRSFNLLVERTRSLETARRQLLANLVHELGRPLGAMLSATQALQDGAVNEPPLRAEFLNGIQDGLLGLRHLLNDLQGLYESANGPITLNRQTVSTGEWLASALTLWRAAAITKSLRWETAIPAELPQMTFDPDRMAQALGNLLNNAIQYTPTGGMVKVTAASTPDAICIQVADTGLGIAPESLSRIFEPLYRGQAHRRFPRGMGLGLSIARDIVSAHGGRIDVTSVLGHGSEFTLWLPLRNSHGEQRSREGK